jgi:hypothetical protein
MTTCPSCGQRKGRRRCPALGQDICPICCGTKRLSEIDCPENCVHLGAARAHPAAVVRKQQEKDVATIMPAIAHLTERQYQLFFLFQTLIARHKTDGLSRLLDMDVADASAATAATLETAARGVIYEHPAASLPAQRLAGEMGALLAEMREAGASVYDREAAIVLRAVEQGARASGGETAYLELMGRILQTNRAARPAAPERAAGAATQSLIIP